MQEIIALNENTWRFEDGGVRFFLLTGTEKALLIDTGMQSPDARKHAESLTCLPLSLLCTHADPDHISGNGSFDTFYLHPDEEANLRAHGNQGAFTPIREGDTIDLGNRPLRIFHLPGHTPGSIAVLDVNARILFGGDVIQDGNIFMFGPHRNLQRYHESLSTFWGANENAFDTVYPSHGTIPLDKGIIPKLIDGARTILDGNAPGKTMPFMGTEITVRPLGFATFLCDA